MTVSFENLRVFGAASSLWLYAQVRGWGEEKYESLITTIKRLLT